MKAPVRFIVRPRAEPQTLGRLIDYVAQLGMIPRRVVAANSDKGFAVLIEQEGLDDQRAGIIAEKMRASIMVESVRLQRGRRLLRPLCERRPSATP